MLRPFVVATFLLSSFQPAFAQTYAPIRAQVMPTIQLPESRSRLAVRRFTPLPIGERSIAAKELTQNQSATLTPTVYRFMTDAKPEHGIMQMSKVDSLIMGGWFDLQPDGVVWMNIGDAIPNAAQSIWLFDCIALPMGGGQITWRGHPKGQSLSADMVGVQVPDNNGRVVFAVDYSALASTAIALSATGSQAWSFAGCEATLVK